MALELERRAARVEEAGVIIDDLARELEKARETIKELEKSHQEVLPALLQAPDRLAIVAYTSAPGERPETEIERLRRLLRESKERTAAEKARNVSMQRWGERALRSRDGKIARAEANLGKLMAHMKELGDRADERVASWHQKLIKAEASAEKRFERLKAASFKCFGEIAKASFDAGHSSCLEGVLRLQPSFSAEALAPPEAISHSAVMAATTKAVRVVSEISVLRED